MNIGTIDCETDPFSRGAEILPFCVGIYTDETYWSAWGDDCIPRAVAYLRSLKTSYTFYAHNGGNFDFYFFLPFIESDIQLINGRIVKCWIGRQEMRDSYAIFPDPLSAYKKDEMNDDDYLVKFSRRNRDNYKSYILDYLRRDCIYLHEAVSDFHARFGDHLTIGGCAMRQLQKFHKFERSNRGFHETIKPFYFGGRNQCFESGVVNGHFKIFDINSQYPSVMRDYRHPIDTHCVIGNHIGPDTFFAEIEAVNHGCLPTRTRAGLDFTIETGTFFATKWEIEAGLDTGTLEVLKVKRVFDFANSIDFSEFIGHYYELRLDAKSKGDLLGNLFYKRIMNACYGKFAQNPEEYHDNCITHGEAMEYPWEIAKTFDDYIVWEKPSLRKSYYNIATGASITGAARALLLRGLSNAVRPLYCDTDSIICEDLRNLTISSDILGAWKNEGEITSIAIAGKKLYAAFHGDTLVKKAHKGAILTGEEIRQVCEGMEIVFQSKAPKFGLGHEPKYQPDRHINMTAKAKAFGARI